ncbi:MAG: exodeoxyribonuclease III [Alphaproteobacteria bacterium]|nr:exodeoxyribonuclease III [Alphaproteobacteria bacterium]
MRIATWNVNSVRQRIEHLTAWLKEAAPDVVCLQELKCLDDAFPRLEIESLGYHVETLGQRTFNGVAILSKHKIEECRRGLPHQPSEPQSRYIEALIAPKGQTPICVASLYAPNGNPLGTEKFSYKLDFLEALIAHAKTWLQSEKCFVIAGDYNIIPKPQDAAHPDLWVNDALFRPESRAKWQELLALGLTDAVRATSDADQIYTFWDYQAGAWQKNNGIRIDHLLLSPQATDALKSSTIDAHVRGWEKPSDHVPVRIDLEF